MIECVCGAYKPANVANRKMKFIWLPDFRCDENNGDEKNVMTHDKKYDDNLCLTPCSNFSPNPALTRRLTHTPNLLPNYTPNLLLNLFT